MRDDEFSSRYRQINAHVEPIAALVTPLGEFDEDATSHDARIIARELCDPAPDVCLERAGVRDASERDG